MIVGILTSSAGQLSAAVAFSASTTGNKTGVGRVDRSMSTNPKTPVDEQALPSNIEKDPHDWTTGNETMTGAQASYLKTLAEEAGEPFDPSLSKADASLKIDELQKRTGRGRNH